MKNSKNMIISKRLCVLILVIIMIIFVVPACSRDKEPTRPAVEDPKPTETPREPASNTDPGSLAAALAEQIYHSGFSGDVRERQKNAEGWAKLWLEYIYPNHGISAVQASYLSSSSHGSLSDRFSLDPMICALEFASQTPIPGAVRLTNGNYEVKLLVVAVTDRDTMTLSGFLSPGQFDEYNAIREVYHVVAQDPRFSAQLKPFPEFKLPKEITAIDMRNLTGYGNTYLEHMLSGGVVASILATSGEQVDLDVSLYDLIRDKPLGQKKLGSFYTYNTQVEDGKLMLNTMLTSSSTPEIIRIDRDFNITRELYSAAKAFVKISPDGTRYTYTDKGNLYLADVKGEKEPQLLMAGNDSHTQDRDYFYPFCWVSNSMIVYARGGYEWSNGCGVYDLSADKNIPFAQVGPNATPSEFKNGKLFTVAGDMGAPYDPYVIDLNDPSLVARKVFSDKDFLKKIEHAAYEISPDGSKIAVLERLEAEGFEFVLYLCSAADGSVLKTYEFATIFNSPQYLDFASDNLLAVFSQRYALSAKYMYLVKLD